jgi:hypothetical protein
VLGEFVELLLRLAVDLLVADQLLLGAAEVVAGFLEFLPRLADLLRSTSFFCASIAWSARDFAFWSIVTKMTSLRPTPGPSKSSGRLSRTRTCTARRRWSGVSFRGG